jgi:hypothetical protein
MKNHRKIKIYVSKEFEGVSQKGKSYKVEE